MLKKIFISAVLLIAVLSFVVSLLGGNNNNEPKVAVGDRVAVINISGPIVDGASVEQTARRHAGCNQRPADERNP